MNNKRGMSAIVTTVIMVALALVAIGIVWAVIGNIIGTSASETAITAKCLKVNLVVDSATSCTGPTTEHRPGEFPPFVEVDGSCDVVVSRKSGGETIGGLKIVVSDGTTSSDVFDETNALDALGSTGVITISDSTIPAGVNLVKVTPYFKDDSGNKIDCATTAELNL